MRLEFRTNQDVSELVLEVVFDEDGLKSLLARLQFLADHRTDHLHFFSGSWGTGDLTQAAEDRNAFNQVNIYLAENPR